MRPRGRRGRTRPGWAEAGAPLRRYVVLLTMKGPVLAKLDPAQFVREVRQEVARVTWPTRKETLITTGLVLALSALAAVFFLLVDQIISFTMRWLFGVGA
jgi:preprotein translocase subunit SecE